MPRARTLGLARGLDDGGAAGTAGRGPYSKIWKPITETAAARYGVSAFR